MIAPQVGSTCPEPDAGFSRSKPILPERREVDTGTAVMWDSQGQGGSDNLGEHRLWRRGNLRQGVAPVVHKWVDSEQISQVPEPQFPHL